MSPVHVSTLTFVQSCILPLLNLILELMLGGKRVSLTEFHQGLEKAGDELASPSELILQHSTVC